jgi:hypothetical protein
VEEAEKEIQVQEYPAVSALNYTTEELIATVRLRARIPNSQIPGTADADIIRLLNEEMKTRLVPGVMKAGEDHFLKTFLVPITATSRYRVPSRAVGLKLKAIMHVDGSGSRLKLSRISRLEASRLAGPGSGTPTAFFLEGPSIVLVPETGTYSGSLELTFYQQPGDLVLSDEYFKIVTIVSTTEVTLEASVPTSWDATQTYDIHSPYSGAETKCWNRAVSTVTGTQVIFSELIDGSVYGDAPAEVGDYFVVNRTAAIPALPLELHVPLAVAAASTLKRPLDPEGAEMLRRDLSEMLAAAGYTIDKRVESSPQSASKPNPMYGDSSRITLRRV